MRTIIFILTSLIVIACKNSEKKSNSIELIADTNIQSSIFNNLMAVTDNGLPENLLNDSLAFLILPIQASCPSCRKKTIDSIVRHQEQLPPDHFIIISAKGGRKTINSYFREQKSQLPVIEGKLFIDSTDKADKFNLYDEKPTMYYTHLRKVYKKVEAVPSTVRQDLKEFFSGYRDN